LILSNVQVVTLHHMLLLQPETLVAQDLEHEQQAGWFPAAVLEHPQLLLSSPVCCAAHLQAPVLLKVGQQHEVHLSLWTAGAMGDEHMVPDQELGGA
jgi:hypothetical protein